MLIFSVGLCFLSFFFFIFISAFYDLFFIFFLLMSHRSLFTPSSSSYLYSIVARFFSFLIFISALICDLIFIFSLLISHQSFFPLSLPPGIHSSKIGFFSGIRTVFTFRPYLLLFLVQLFGWLGVTFIQGNYALYIKYALDMEALYPYVDASVAAADASDWEEGVADCRTVDVHGHHSVSVVY